VSRGVLVFLHGHDDSAERWRAAAEAMAPAGWAVERPTGPRPAPGGASWFGSDDDGLPDAGQVHAALDAVAAHVRAAAERHGTGIGAVTLAGFSQGAALALLLALRSPGTDQLAAVVAVSGWLPDVEGIAPVTDRLAARRVLIAHGTDDDVVPFPLGRSVARLLQRQGHDVTTVEHDTGHDPTPFAGDIRDWLDSPTPKLRAKAPQRGT
jgi:predicted esterase